MPNGGSLTKGPDGNIWFAAGARIGTMKPDGSVQYFNIPFAFAGQITAGPDGALWYTESGDQVVTRMTTGGAFQRYEAETPAHDVLSCDYITAGPDGNVWFSESPGVGNISHIARVTLSGTITQFTVPNYADVITAGPGGYLWYTEPHDNMIGVIAP